MKTAQAFTADERKTYIGASEVAAILGLDRYRTRLDVYNEKRGLAPAFEGNNQTERGNRLEAIAAEYFTEKTGTPLRRKSDAFTHPDHPFIVGHVDRVVVGEKRLVEIKCPSVAMFRKLQREGLPENYVIQAQVYMGLAGFPKLTFDIFCADVWDAAIFDIDFDETIYSAAIAGVVTFWNNYIVPGVAPTDADEHAKVDIEKGEGSVTFRDDENFIAKAQAIREAVTLKRDAEELFEIAKKDLLDAVENECGTYEGGGIRLHYNEQAGRKTFDKKALAAAFPQIDLSQFEKQGASFKSFKTYFINNTGE